MRARHRCKFPRPDVETGFVRACDARTRQCILRIMGQLGAKIDHPTYGEGVIFNQDGDYWRVFFKEHGEKEFDKSFDGWTVIEEGMEEGHADLSDITTAVEMRLKSTSTALSNTSSLHPLNWVTAGMAGRWSCSHLIEICNRRRCRWRPSFTKLSWSVIGCV